MPRVFRIALSLVTRITPRSILLANGKRVMTKLVIREGGFVLVVR